MLSFLLNLEVVMLMWVPVITNNPYLIPGLQVEKMDRDVLGMATPRGVTVAHLTAYIKDELSQRRGWCNRAKGLTVDSPLLIVYVCHTEL